MLAVPVVKGIKSPSERFAGADETYTIEALMQNGWALQSGTSHFLGQNFARAVDVTFQSKEVRMRVRDLFYSSKAFFFFLGGGGGGKCVVFLGCAHV